MTSIVKHNQRVFAAYNFLDLLDASGGQDHHIYVGLGRSASWADDSNPPAPTDTIDDETDFWTNLQGVKKIDTTDVVLVVPRNDWTNGTTYQVFDTSSTNAYVDPFYVMNSANEIYVCTQTSGSGSTSEPAGHNNGNEIDNTGIDGYKWQYVGELLSQDLTDLGTTNWMPVPTHDKVSANQTNYGDLEIHKTLGANYVMLRAIVLGTGVELDGIDQYRQIAVLFDPIDNVAAPLTATTAVAGGMEASLSPGILMHLDNRKPIYRSTDQTEQIQIVIQF